MFWKYLRNKADKYVNSKWENFQLYHFLFNKKWQKALGIWLTYYILQEASYLYLVQLWKNWSHNLLWVYINTFKTEHNSWLKGWMEKEWDCLKSTIAWTLFKEGKWLENQKINVNCKINNRRSDETLQRQEKLKFLSDIVSFFPKQFLISLYVPIDVPSKLHLPFSSNKCHFCLFFLVFKYIFLSTLHH